MSTKGNRTVDNGLIFCDILDMLSDEDKKEMLADAYDAKRRVAFADSRSRSLKLMTWTEYLNFLKSMQNFITFPSKPQKTLGENFKL